MHKIYWKSGSTIRFHLNVNYKISKLHYPYLMLHMVKFNGIPVCTHITFLWKSVVFHLISGLFCSVLSYRGSIGLSEERNGPKTWPLSTVVHCVSGLFGPQDIKVNLQSSSKIFES